MKYFGVMVDLIIAGAIIQGIKYYGQKKYNEGYAIGCEETRKLINERSYEV